MAIEAKGLFVKYPEATVSLMTNVSHSFFLEYAKVFEEKVMLA